ncbi:YkgJ family cysteine cluster protein [Clostridium sp. MSJ-11]|uniref:YkgJ family cysteine cluster protein n=1 Tax=Clostridium mobile TaxID=2841512 RepID=A0ABS6EBZ9_9CLOT|nr:YkgJ family cysteine cluster protein [Clostridium mobile]MBU5482714.1 YkgJ family cysteine cluster protein [Clostridium mobile]
MSTITKCFCGSGKEYNKCHKEIKINSKFAKTYKFYRKIDSIMNKKINENLLNIVCKKGCSECCFHIFSISEVEFCIIVDYITKHFNKLQLEDIMKESLEIREILYKDHPDYMNRLNINITGIKPEDYIYYVTDSPGKLKKGCALLNSKDQCSIYKVRPSICRTHGVAYFHENYTNILCSKLKVDDSNRSNFVDLTDYREEYDGLYTFTNSKNNSTVIRRVYPLFYWFCLLEDKEMSLNQFKKTEVYKKYTTISEREFLDNMHNITY